MFLTLLYVILAIGSIYNEEATENIIQIYHVLAENYTSAEYIGFVDTDCFFITYVDRNDLFEYRDNRQWQKRLLLQNRPKELAVSQETTRITYQITGLLEPVHVCHTGL